MSLRRVLATAATLGALLAVRAAWALDPSKSLSECAVKTWQVRDGLPGAWVRGVAQTSDGYLWIATFGGLARLDGVRLTRVAGKDATARGLVGGTVDGTVGGTELAPFDVTRVLPNGEGGLWIVSANDELLCLRAGPSGECFAGPARRPKSISATALANSTGGAWLGTRDGLCWAEAGRITPAFRVADAGSPEVTAVHEDRRGRLWVGGDNGLYVRAKGEDRFTLFAGRDAATPEHISDIYEALDGRLWIAARSALMRIAGDAVRVYRAADGLPNARLSRVIEDRDGNVWIGSGAGLVRLRDDRFVVYTTADGLPDDSVTEVLEDREGSLWVGTRSGGLAQFSDRTLSTKDVPAEVLGSRVDSVIEAGDGAMWFATQRGAVRQTAAQIQTLTTEEGLPGNSVNAILPGRAGDVWIGTARGLARWKAGRLDVPVPKAGNVTTLYLDQTGGLWVGIDSSAKLHHVAPDGQVETFTDQDGLPAGRVLGAGEDDRGALWITSAGGLARRDGRRFVRVDSADGLRFGDLRSIHRDGQGTLWFASAGRGLLRRRAGRFAAVTSTAGLPSDHLFWLVSDDLGFLWVGTATGVFRVAKTAFDDVVTGRKPRLDAVTFEVSDRRQGVSGFRIRQPGAWKARDGRVWFATDEGALSIDPTRARANPLPPPVWIEEATVDGRTARAGDANRFPPGPGTLEFHYAGVTLLEAHKARHRYLLEGFDRRWTEAGPRRAAYYTNIPAGDYRFRVQASNADGVWNETGATVAFVLAPHFYRTPWFYAACALALVGLAFWLHRARVLILRGQYLAVFAERSRVARELHDTLLQGMSAVNMHLHAVRTQLPSEAEAARKQLGSVQDLVTQSLEDARQFVWNLREQDTGTGDLGVALARLARRLCEGQAVTCEVEVVGVVRHLSHDVQNELFRITQEALVNALRHANARRIDVRLCYEADGVKLAVTDDGRGFDPGTAEGGQAGHFGLVGLRERAARIGAALSITSAPGRGTTIEVKRRG